MNNLFTIIWNIVYGLFTQTLQPGICQCGHARCFHINGKKGCNAWFPPSDTGEEEWCQCSCVCYVEDDDDDDGFDDDPEPETPSPEELERMYNK